jgi:redox-sensitive bicupin YhaK (pirin superfamily)
MKNHQPELVIASRERDLGGFSVRRVLPEATHHMVGPFIFFDHMGPSHFESGHGIDVRPHPHIGLATVTYLFEGKIRHRDSLGSNQLIEPGDINWMTAGRGIVHSERTPDDVRKSDSNSNGIQCWVALPNEFEESEPSFKHHASNTLPEFSEGDVKLKLLLGESFGRKSPVTIHSDLFYLEARFEKGQRLEIPADGRESAAYVVDGEIQVSEQIVASGSMAVANNGDGLSIFATRSSKVMILGGKPVGPRYIFWNFVASSKEKMEAAKKDWAPGPRVGSRFLPIPGDDQEFIPLPKDIGMTRNTPGTPL